MLELASEYVLLSPAIEELAVVLQAKGISAMDALHVATASVAGVDYFCTTDDRLFRKIQGVQELGCKVITLLNLVLEIK